MLKTVISIFFCCCCLSSSWKQKSVRCCGWFLHRCAFVGQSERVRAVPLPVCQVVCAACKPPDVSETSHWRGRAEWADYHGGLDAIRSPGHRQQIWHTPGPGDCPLEKIKSILYVHDETSWQRCRTHRQVLFPPSSILDGTILLAGVDAIRAVTIQALCHVMREKSFFYFFCFKCLSDWPMNTHVHTNARAHAQVLWVFYHLPLSFPKAPGDTVFPLFDVPRLCLSWLTDWVTCGRGSYLVAMETAICPASNPARSLKQRTARVQRTHLLS